MSNKTADHPGDESDPYFSWEFEGKLPSADMALIMIKNGDVRHFSKYLEIASRLGVLNINKIRWSGFTFLHRAAQNGQIEIMELIVKYGGDPNIRTTFGWYTPMHLALANGYGETAFRLMGLGANYSIKNKQGDDACAFAAKRGYASLAGEFKGRILKHEAMKMFASSTLGGKTATSTK